MTERFEPADAIVVEGVDEEVHEHFGGEEKYPGTESDVVRTVDLVGRQRKSRYDEQGEQDRMREPAVRQQVASRARPQTRHEINIGYALRQRSPDHGLLAKATLKERFAYTGAEGNMGK